MKKIVLMALCLLSMPAFAQNDCKILAADKSKKELVIKCEDEDGILYLRATMIAYEQKGL